MIPNYDQEIEKMMHPENFDDLANVEKMTVYHPDSGKKKLEIGKIGKGKFKYGIRRHK